MTAAVGPESENLTGVNMRQVEADEKVIKTYKTPLRNSRQWAMVDMLLGATERTLTMFRQRGRFGRCEKSSLTNPCLRENKNEWSQGVECSRVPTFHDELTIVTKLVPHLSQERQPLLGPLL